MICSLCLLPGAFHVVEYLGWETTYTEIVASDRLRLKSQEPPLNPRTFLKFNIPLPGVRNKIFNIIAFNIFLFGYH